MLADERLTRVPRPEHGHEVDPVAEAGHVVRAGENAAREVLLANVPGGHQQLLGRLSHRLHVVVLVDDRVADHEDLDVAKPLERTDHRVGRIPFPELAQEGLGLLRVDVEVHVE